MAGKNSDLDFIRSHHDGTMSEYRAIRDELSPTYGVKEDSLPDIPEDMLMDAYAGLSEFAGAGDYDLAKMVVDSVKEYKLPAEDQKRFAEIQTKLAQMDWDGILLLLPK